MMQLDLVVIPPAFLWNPYLILTKLTFDLDTYDLWPWHILVIFSGDFSSHRRTDRQKVVHRSPHVPMHWQSTFLLQMQAFCCKAKHSFSVNSYTNSLILSWLHYTPGDSFAVSCPLLVVLGAKELLLMTMDWATRVATLPRVGLA